MPKNIKEKGTACFLKLIDITYQYIKKKREENKIYKEGKSEILNNRAINTNEIQKENRNEIKTKN